MNASANNLPQKLRMTSSGFTLIELMVTIAVLAIIVSIAAPSIIAQLAQGQIRATSTLIQTSIARAKVESAISRSNVIWTYSNADNSIVLSNLGKTKTIASYILNDSSVLTFNPTTATTLLISKEGMITEKVTGTVTWTAANVAIDVSDSRTSASTQRVRINTKRAFECSGTNC